MTPGDALPGALRRHRDQPDPPVSEGQIGTTADREAADPQFRKPNAVQSDSAAVTGATMNPLFATLSLSLPDDTSSNSSAGCYPDGASPRSPCSYIRPSQI